MSTLLIGSLAMSASTIRPYERPRTSSNHVGYSPRNHLDKDHGNVVDHQGKAKDQVALNKIGRSRTQFLSSFVVASYSIISFWFETLKTTFQASYKVLVVSQPQKEAARPGRTLNYPRSR